MRGRLPVDEAVAIHPMEEERPQLEEVNLEGQPVAMEAIQQVSAMEASL